MTNIGIVGLGFMAATHLKTYRDVPNARVTALCNPSGRHLDGDFSGVAGNVGDNAPVKLEPGSFKAYQHYKEMLADPGIDAIDVCAPTFAHPELTVLALEAGKHVLCEKPMARSVRQARRMVEAARKAKKILMPAMCLRFWPGWSDLKEIVKDERYGKVLSASFRRIAEPPAWGQSNFLDGQRSGGALFDLHIHDTDFVQFCFGRPRAVQSTGYIKISGAVDHVITEYHVPSGAMVTAEGSWAMAKGFGFNMSYLVNFENATVDYDLSRGEKPMRIIEADQEPQIITPEGPDGYVRELRHFVDSIENNEKPSIVTAENGLSAVEICEGEEMSIRERGAAAGQLVFI